MEELKISELAEKLDSDKMLDSLRSFVDDLVKSFESDEKNKGKRYREFLYHCFIKFEEQIKKIKSKKIINKYETMRNNTFSYLIQNEKEITLKLSR